ncbi:MAG: MBL fold metallo-hydrolase [Desulfobacterota bacterium]|nr:MBL fold metallo-hydrolase [Thermodesulfobacteriota bacterium]MDW8001618.1 MBL fold metallo-hydrolase [Deltaproteobacteria bacterium]
MEIRRIDALSVTVAIDNFYDAFFDDPPCGKRYRTLPSRSIYAEHGLSFFVNAFLDRKKYSFIFDFGVDGELLLHNFEVLKIEPKGASALILSHGHFDHYGGLLRLVRHLGSSGIKGLPLYLGSGTFARRFAKKKDDEGLIDLGMLRREELEGVTRVYEIEEPLEFLPGCYISGRIEMKNDYEDISSGFFVEREGILANDDFREELALFFLLRRGLVIISGCAHRGIVNTVTQIVDQTGIRKIYALFGGFHLLEDETRIRKTIEGLEAFSPDYVILCHCSSLSAKLLFMKLVGKRCIINTVGTTYNL